MVPQSDNLTPWKRLYMLRKIMPHGYITTPGGTSLIEHTWCEHMADEPLPWTRAILGILIGWIRAKTSEKSPKYGLITEFLSKKITRFRLFSTISIEKTLDGILIGWSRAILGFMIGWIRAILGILIGWIRAKNSEKSPECAHITYERHGHRMRNLIARGPNLLWAPTWPARPGRQNWVNVRPFSVPKKTMSGVNSVWSRKCFK